MGIWFKVGRGEEGGVEGEEEKKRKAERKSVGDGGWRGREKGKRKRGSSPSTLFKSKVSAKHREASFGRIWALIQGIEGKKE